MPFTKLWPCAASFVWLRRGTLRQRLVGPGLEFGRNRPEDKRLVVGALGGANTPVALALALQALANAELEPEAALAIVMIAEKLPPSHAAAARQALENVARLAKESAIRERAEKTAQDVGRKVRRRHLAALIYCRRLTPYFSLFSNQTGPPHCR